MATSRVTLVGVSYRSDLGVSPQSGVPTTFVGEAYLTDLGVGGGPVIPPGQPPGIWGPTDPRPSPPIYIPPGQPPGIWGPTDPRPSPPINLVPQPEPPEVPEGTPPNSVVKEAPPGGWGYYTDADTVLYAAFRTEKQPK